MEAVNQEDFEKNEDFCQFEPTRTPLRIEAIKSLKARMKKLTK